MTSKMLNIYFKVIIFNYRNKYKKKYMEEKIRKIVKENKGYKKFVFYTKENEIISWEKFLY